MYNSVADIYCKDPNLLLAVYKEMIESGMSEEEVLSKMYAFCPTRRDALYLRNALPISWNNIHILSIQEDDEYIKNLSEYNNMKFDYIIQNPPYNGSLHLDFLEKGLDLLTEKGRMVIIEPATWLINVRKNGKAKKYDAIKKRIEGHVESVKIENYNKEFNIGAKVPFATTVIDFSKTFDKIEFTCFGEKQIVESIYDCNLIGKHQIVRDILEKCLTAAESMSKRVTKRNVGVKGVKYLKFDEILTVPMGKYGSSAEDMLDLPCFMCEIGIGKYPITYLAPAFSQVDGTIYESVPFAKKRGASKELSNNPANCIYGTREELENWKHFIFNNKLPLFLNIVLTIDQNNCSKEFLPWLVDKQYTDEEINEMFGFTDEEIALIDRTIKKYERNSPWFKRYMCGPDSVSDEEVNNFINNL